MKRLFNILILLFLTTFTFAQDETRVIDSLESVMAKQEGREKVLTMIELVWEFYEVSYDDCLNWGEKAIKEAQTLGFPDLEADATYALAMQYGYHSDLDLAQYYLKKAYVLHHSLDNDARAFEDLWNQAYFEQIWGNVDSAFKIYENVLSFAEQRGDTLAMANTYANMAVIRYQINDFESSETYYKKCHSLYVGMDNQLEAARTIASLANIYMEWGRFAESKKLYREAILMLESLENYEFLMLAYKNYGILFEKEKYNSDSICYYFDKALQCIEVALSSRENYQDIIIVKADLLLEYGNLNYMQEDYNGAIKKFVDVLSISESVGYLFGQMKAFLGLGFVYSQLGSSEKSLYYLDKFLELESKVGTSMTHLKMRIPLMIIYARVGRFEEFEYELDHFNEEYSSLVRQIVDIEKKNDDLEQYASGLLERSESQSEQIQTLQTQRNHCRLAFFGLLAIALFALALLIAYKIVRKKRAKV